MSVKKPLDRQKKITQREVTMHLSGLIVQYDSVNITKTRIVAIVRHDKQTDMQNN